MVALNAAYAKCKILHGNISNRAILLQKTVDGIKGVLAEFDYATYAGDDAGAVEAPEPMLFQSIRCLDHPGAARTPLDDCEPLFYLVCWLDTFGVNQAQCTAYAAEYAARNKPHLPILNWNKGSVADIADHKRHHMATERSFRKNILSKMRENSPLRALALDMYRVLFLHPGCNGTNFVDDEELAEMGDGDIPAALRAIPAIDGSRDLLALRGNPALMNAIRANLLEVLAKHGDAALAALNTGQTEKGSKAVTLPSAVPSMKHYRDEVSLAGPAKRLRP
ncbi:hypothetical protein GGI17_002726 [Coemansia sp. S146]|nr:hypothetical protein GGI17_002726 [Coemansia sp. S146]